MSCELFDSNLILNVPEKLIVYIFSSEKNKKTALTL